MYDYHHTIYIHIDYDIDTSYTYLKKKMKYPNIYILTIISLSHLILFINTSINATIIISDNNNSGLRRQPFNNINKDDTSYGHTFLVKVHNNTKYGTRIYVHTDCRVALLDGNNIQKEMANSLIAISNPLGSPCNKNDVNGIGVSTSGTYAIVTYGTSISVLSFAENDEDDDLNIPKTLKTLQPRPVNIISNDNNVFVTYKRITNGIYDKKNNRDLFIGIGWDQQNDGHVLIIASSGEGATLSLKIIASLKIGPDLYDVRPYDGYYLLDSLMVANCKSGLQVLNYDVEKNQLVKVPKGAFPLSYSSGSTADGMDVTPNFAYIAAQGDGLYVFDLKKKQLVGKTNDGLNSGWAGGVRAIGNLALIAADPGLVIYDIKDPTKPTLKYVCKMGGKGKGWNIALDKSSNTVFLADNEGGLQIVQLIDGGKAKIIGHFGMGVIQDCDGSGGD